MSEDEDDKWIGDYIDSKSHYFLKKLFGHMGILDDPKVKAFLHEKYEKEEKDKNDN